MAGIGSREERKPEDYTVNQLHAIRFKPRNRCLVKEMFPTPPSITLQSAENGQETNRESKKQDCTDK